MHSAIKHLLINGSEQNLDFHKNSCLYQETAKPADMCYYDAILPNSRAQEARTPDGTCWQTVLDVLLKEEDHEFQICRSFGHACPRMAS